MVFETRKIQIETLGEYLKAARATFGFSIDKAAQGAGVNLRWLKALEENETENLPADIYVLGALKRLAGFYNLEEGILLEQYKKERQIDSHIKPKKNLPGRLDMEFWRRLVITPKVIAFGVAALFVFFTLAYLVWQVLTINRAPLLEIIAPQDQQVLKTLSVEVTGRTDVGMDIAVNGQDIFVDNTGKFKALASVSPGTQDIKVTAKNRFGKQTEKSVRVFIQPDQTETEAGAILVLNFSAPVDLTFSIDGDVLKQQHFESGENFEIKAREIIHVAASDGGAVSGKLNNQDLGVLGKPGEPLAELTFLGESDNIK
jgi:cytoskeletal protein RodZ